MRSTQSTSRRESPLDRAYRKRNHGTPGLTYRTQTPKQRAALRQCREQGLWPVATDPHGSIIAMWRGHMYVAFSEAPCRLARTTIRGAMRYFRWMLDDGQHITIHRAGDDMTYSANVQLRWMHIGFNPSNEPIDAPIVPAIIPQPIVRC